MLLSIVEKEGHLVRIDVDMWRVFGLSLLSKRKTSRQKQLGELPTKIDKEIITIARKENNE